jgi:hypothetical protein
LRNSKKASISLKISTLGDSDSKNYKNCIYLLIKRREFGCDFKNIFLFQILNSI